MEQQEIIFGPFRLDRANARLLRDGRPVGLTPKALDVLAYLAQRPDRLVSKEELLAAVWPDVVVSDASVKVCVREARKALGDEADTPRFIETVHRRGYRFIGKAETESGRPPPAASAAAEFAAPSGPPAVQSPRHPLVGREKELRRLTGSLARATAGQRQVVLVSGGPGSGKTSLVEAFLRDAPAGVSVATGHCFEHFGTSEPYLPVWEALGRLNHERQSQALSALLARHGAATAVGISAAPHPSSRPTPPAAPAASEPRVVSDRMLREMAEALEACAAEAPLVLVLEDLHWADYSTIDLLTALAGRGGRVGGSSRLMLVGTFRPAEVMLADHPLRGVATELISRRLASEVPLEFLDEAAVGQYLAERFAGTALPPLLATKLHQRTEGHPLFLVNLVDDLVEQGVLREEESTWRVPEGGEWLTALDDAVPPSARAMIEAQLARLGDRERRVLEAAAVAGVEFSAAAVAAAEGDDLVQAEGVCEDLARRHRFLEPHGAAEWPDGTLAGRYRFLHELYHNVVYGGIPAARAGRLHQCLGQRLEAAWASRPGDHAAELAVHFERGRDWPRAVKYLRAAADGAARQFAHREAVEYLRRAQSALDRLPPAQRAEHELSLLMSLGVHLQVTRGFAAPEVREVHARAYELCESGGGADTRAAFPVMWGIWLFHKVRSDLRPARDLAGRLLALARESGDDGLLVQAHQAMCVTSLCLGEPAVTRDHMEQAAARYNPDRHAANTHLFGQDPGVACLSFGAVALWLLGNVDQAARASARAVELAERLSQPSTLALALHFAAMLHQCRGDAPAADALAARSVGLSAEEGFSFWHAGGTILRGWCRATGRAEAGGIDDIRRGVDAWLATGSRTYHTYHLGLLADSLLRHGRRDEALATVDEALRAAGALPEGLYEAELHRLRGKCLAGADAEACFTSSVVTARRQGATSLETRAEADLADLRKPATVSGSGSRAPSGRTRS